MKENKFLLKSTYKFEKSVLTKSNSDNDFSDFPESFNPKIIHQYQVGNLIRESLYASDLTNDLEFIRYKESKNKISFTCSTDDFIFWGKVQIINGNGSISKLERYPKYKNSKDYKDIILELYNEFNKTQKQIAHRLGLSQSTVSRILRH